MEQITNIDRDALGLSLAATGAVAVLSRLDGAERRAALEALGLSELRRTWTPRTAGELPSLMALARERDREAVYTSPRWLAAYRRGQTVVVYLLQAPGLRRLSADLGGVSLVKLGTTALANLSRRIADLGRTEYGGWSRGERRYERDEGFRDFTPPPRLQLAPQHAVSPVRLCLHGLEVDLPPGLSANEFEAALNRILSPVRLQSFGGSEAGRALCTRCGVAPSRLQRFHRQGTRFKAATEITLARPQADIGALARVCQDIVVDATLGLQSRRPAR